jgi:hypothetical protein
MPSQLIRNSQLETQTLFCESLLRESLLRESLLCEGTGHRSPGLTIALISKANHAWPLAAGIAGSRGFDAVSRAWWLVQDC